MATNTTNYQLVKVALADSPPDITAINPNWDKIDAELKKNADSAKAAQTYETATGTGTAIIIATVEFLNGISRTFVAAAANNGAATTLNGKPLYKPGTTTSPKIVAGKAYTVWYSTTGGCFFLKASAEGTAVAANVLAGTTFSNDDDTGIPGEMVDNGPAVADTINLTSNNQEYTIANGRHSGLRKIKAVITNLAAGVIKAGTTVGGVLGTFTSDANAVAAELLAGVTAYVNGNKITGTMPNRGKITQSLGINGSYTIPNGYHDGTGVVSQSVATKGAATITPSTANQVISAGQYLSGDQTIAGDPDLVSANIKAGANIFGVAGNSNVVDTSDASAGTGQIISGFSAYSKGVKLSGAVPQKSAQTYTPGTTDQTISAWQYLSGIQTISGSANLVAGNIKSGVNIFGVIGTFNNGIKSIQVAEIGDYTTLRTVTINSVVPANTMLIVQCYIQDNNGSWTLTLTNSTTLTVTDYNGQFRAYVYIVEFMPGVIKSKQRITIGTSITSGSKVTIASVDPAKCVVLQMSSYHGSVLYATHGKVTSATQMTVARKTASFVDTLEIIEFN